MDANEIFELPLFPLNTVLYPGGLLPLHVFEPRYRAMVRACLDEQSPFGVVMIRSGLEVGETAEPHQIGTTARIIQVQHRSPESIYLWANGEDRFKVWDYSLSASNYLVGRVSKLPEDQTDPQLLSDEINTVKVKLTAYLDLYAAVNKSDPINVEDHLAVLPGKLSYQVAGLLNISTMEKQSLLELNDTAERLTREISLLDRETIYLQQLSASPLNPNTFKLPWGDDINLN